MNNLLIETLNKAINRYLDLDPDCKKHLANLSGKMLSVKLLGLSVCLFFEFTSENIIVTQQTEKKINVTVGCAPFTLLRTILESKKNGKATTSDMQIDGDVALAQEIMQFFNKIDIDWEEHLSKITGDQIARRTGKLFEKIHRWGKETKETLRLNLDEFIHEEKRLTPSSEELQDFFNDVDQLNLAVERLDAKVSTLERKE